MNPYKIGDKVVLLSTQTVEWSTKENDAIHTVTAAIENASEGQLISLDDKYYARGLPAGYFRLATELELQQNHRLPEEWTGSGFKIFKFVPAKPPVTLSMQYKGVDDHRFIADLLKYILVPEGLTIVNWSNFDTTTGNTLEIQISNGIKTHRVYVGINYYVFFDPEHQKAVSLQESEMLDQFKEYENVN